MIWLSWLPVAIKAIPWRVLFALGVLVALVLLHAALNRRAIASERSRVALAGAQEALETTREAQRIEQARIQAVQGIDRERVQRETRLRAAAAGARGELERLRAQIAAFGAVPGNPGTAGSADGPAASLGLLGACAVRYEGVAGDAEALASQVIGLQAYIAEACR